MPESSLSAPTQTLPKALRICIDSLEDKKAQNIQVLDLRGISTITDYFVIATGTSQPHLRAMSQEVGFNLKKSGEPSTQTGSGEQSGWSVVDAYDVIVHIFTQETRDFFNLEGLWKDARPVEI